MNQISRALNHVKAIVPRVFSLHDRQGVAHAYLASPNPTRMAQQLCAWEPQITTGWTVIEWIDGEPVGAIADRSVKV